MINFSKKKIIKQIKKDINNIVKSSLEEDLGKSININFDITSKIFKENKLIKSNIYTKENGVFCGKMWLEEVFYQIDNNINIIWKVSDGDELKKDQLICIIQGPIKCLLAGERTALNFIQTLSGVSSKVKKYIEIIKNTKTKLRDTRKTIPGLRSSLKYAVLCGGAENHRFGLFDGILIKDNHIEYIGSIKKIINMTRLYFPKSKLEIEVRNIKELKEAITSKADLIMLDNFKYEDVIKAVIINKNQSILEASGNINKKNLLKFASTGVDYISLGELTKNIKSLDLTMNIDS
ncbi:nadC [Wigglesworthia glossinidia endosymbiont of Glossina brevipalpis]|uniref:nicotinate-nucleotide diphosphorylase (carboxylating) n=1 Tax=Wigglesworthia glossinidia brevipalpis TaxID=36870 RepID=Q8D2N0_WIGBR|nr:nadC [Wigglesworthia glossinidia endosymbiont of Glossina brevipalpis]